jgi:chaperone modulatory protein CbpM
MSKSKLPDIITAVIIDEPNPLTFEELCHALQTEQQFVIRLVENDILQPHGITHNEWRFDSYNFKRAKTAASFYHDLEVNLNGIALALDLLDEIDRLKKLT